MIIRPLIAVWLFAMLAVAEEPALVGLSMIEEARGLPAAVMEAMREETGRILTPAGVRVKWYESDAALQSLSLNRLVVVRLVGASRSGIELKAAEGVLGVTHMSEGRVLPFIDVDVQRVGRAIKWMGGGVRAIQPGEYGRALGRVLAHELYHVLSGSVRHDSEGVSKGVLNAHELLQSELLLSAESCRLIRNALRAMDESE